MDYKTRLQFYGLTGGFAFTLGIGAFLLASIVFATDPTTRLLAIGLLAILIVICVFALWARHWNKKGLKDSLAQLRREYKSKVISKDQEFLFNTLAQDLNEPNYREN